MSIRVRFFAAKPIITNVQGENIEAYGTQQHFMWALLLLGEDDVPSPLRKPSISKTQLTKFLSRNASKRTGNEIFKQRFAEFATNLEELGTPLRLVGDDDNGIYFLESVEQFEVDVWDVGRLVAKIDMMPWLSTSVIPEIDTIHSIYLDEFMSGTGSDSPWTSANKVKKAARRKPAIADTEALDWIKNKRDLIKALLAMVYDKYCVCLMAEGEWEVARSFILREWLPRMNDHDDVVWGYFRLMQIFIWTDRKRELNNTYQSAKSVCREFDTSVLDTLYELAQSQQYPKAPQTVDANEFLLYGEEFSESDRLGCPIANLDNQPRQDLVTVKQEFGNASKVFVRDERSKFLGRLRVRINEFLASALEERIRIPTKFTLVSDFGREQTEISTSRASKIILEETTHSVLITGVSGIGKTIMLYDLASQYLSQAFGDSQAKIPIIVPLSYWRPTYKSITDLLLSSAVNEMYGGIAYDEFTSWVDAKQIILLLDGIEDIAIEERQRFLDALIQFRDTRGNVLPEIIITYRSPNTNNLETYDPQYELIRNQLQLKHFWTIVLNEIAVSVQDDYLRSRKTSGLQRFLQVTTLPWARDLAQSPLTLTLMAKIYADWTLDDLMEGAPTTTDELWKQYVDHQHKTHPFESGTSSWSKRETVLQFLTWLARRMPGTDFNPNMIDSSWIDEGTHKRRIRTTTSSIFILASLLSFAITFLTGLGVAMDPNVIVPIMAPLAATGMWLAAWAAMDLAGRILLNEEAQPETYILDNLKWSAHYIHSGKILRLMTALRWGIVCGVVGLVVGTVFASVNVALIGMQLDFGGGLGIGLGALALGIMLWYVFSRQKLIVVEPIVIGLISGLVYAVGAAIIAELLFAFQSHFPGISTLGGALACGLAVGLCTGICKTFYIALRKGYPRPDAHIIIEQSPGRSIRKALVASTIFSVIGSTIAILMTFIITGLISLSGATPATTVFRIIPLWAAAAFNVAILFFIASFLFLGGINVIDHLMARRVLDKQGLFPLKDYQVVLNHATKLQFLRRIGTRYEFWHSTFRDYMQRQIDRL